MSPFIDISNLLVRSFTIPLAYLLLRLSGFVTCRLSPAGELVRVGHNRQPVASFGRWSTMKDASSLLLMLLVQVLHRPDFESVLKTIAPCTRRGRLHTPTSLYARGLAFGLLSESFALTCHSHILTTLLILPEHEILLSMATLSMMYD